MIPMKRIDIAVQAIKTLIAKRQEQDPAGSRRFKRRSNQSCSAPKRSQYAWRVRRYVSVRYALGSRQCQRDLSTRPLWQPMWADKIAKLLGLSPPFQKRAVENQNLTSESLIIQVCLPHIPISIFSCLVKFSSNLLVKLSVRVFVTSQHLATSNFGICPMSAAT